MQRSLSSFGWFAVSAPIPADEQTLPRNKVPGSYPETPEALTTEPSDFAKIGVVLAWIIVYCSLGFFCLVLILDAIDQARANAQADLRTERAMEQR